MFLRLREASTGRVYFFQASQLSQPLIFRRGSCLFLFLIKILFSSVNFFCFVHVTGSYAVVSLFVAQVCEREVGSFVLEPSPTPGNGSISSPPPDTTNGLWTPVDAMKLEIAVSLSMLVGIIQVI